MASRCMAISSMARISTTSTTSILTLPKGERPPSRSIGTFDSLNPFIIRGVGAAGVGMLFESLTRNRRTSRFPSTGCSPRSIEMPEDRSWVAFTLRPEARWHDGKPVTVDDVIFSSEHSQRSKGQPFYRAYYKNVVKAEAAGERRVKFTFDQTHQSRAAADHRPDADPAQALLRGLRVRSDHAEPPLGSGPYRDQVARAGANMVYERVEGLLGRRCAGQSRLLQFRRVRYEYYRDANVALEAFKAGAYDIRQENTSKFWATGYTGPMFDAGWIVTEEIPNELGTGMQGFAFNTRRPLFQDPKVRRGAGLRLRFRVDQPHHHVRAVHPHGELLLQYRAGRRGPAERGRARAARAVPRPAAGGGVHHGLPRALDRGRRRHPAEPAHRAATAGRGGLDGRGRPAGQCAGPAVPVRDPAERAVVRAPHPAVHQEPGAARHRGDACAPSIRRSIRTGWTTSIST